MANHHSGDGHATFGDYSCFVRVHLKTHHRGNLSPVSDYSAVAYVRHKDAGGAQKKVDKIKIRLHVDGGPASYAKAQADVSDIEYVVKKQGGHPSQGLWAFVDFWLPGIGHKEVGAVARTAPA